MWQACEARAGQARSTGRDGCWGGREMERSKVDTAWVEQLTPPLLMLPPPSSLLPARYPAVQARKSSAARLMHAIFGEKKGKKEVAGGWGG